MTTTSSTKKAAAPRYTVDWFTNNVPSWQRTIVPRFAGKPMRALDVGCLEGRSSLWLLDNVLTHPSARITCIDVWPSSSSKPRGADVHAGAWDAFRSNLEPHAKKVRVMRGDHAACLRALDARRHQYDLVYIDPAGSARSALECAVLAFPLLSPGGWMVIDDYTWSAEHDGRCPRGGVDAFLFAYAQDVRVIKSSGWQMIVERRRRPLERPPCRSELFPTPRLLSRPPEAAGRRRTP